MAIYFTYVANNKSLKLHGPSPLPAAGESSFLLFPLSFSTSSPSLCPLTPGGHVQVLRTCGLSSREQLLMEPLLPCRVPQGFSLHFSPELSCVPCCLWLSFLPRLAGRLRLLRDPLICCFRKQAQRHRTPSIFRVTFVTLWNRPGKAREPDVGKLLRFQKACTILRQSYMIWFLTPQLYSLVESELENGKWESRLVGKVLSLGIFCFLNSCVLN